MTNSENMSHAELKEYTFKLEGELAAHRVLNAEFTRRMTKEDKVKCPYTEAWNIIRQANDSLRNKVNMFDLAYVRMAEDEASIMVSLHNMAIRADKLNNGAK